ncbi:hypothetical protein BU17DRAFT_60139 [Hysterangium stoloniferum]|nr:hypothetical protein BU17DRAFT_60139 [Hysterangium stoloniferum]
MPVTRATTRNKVKETVSQELLEPYESEMGSSTESQEDADGVPDEIDVYIGNIQKSVMQMKKELQSLRKKNSDLRGRLKAQDVATKRSANGSLAGPSNASVKSLENTIASLQVRFNQSNKKYRRQIEKMRAKELKAEAADLLGEAILLSEDERDTPQRMRKLLRKFTDLMLVTTLAEGGEETCPICLEKLELKKCSSLTCEHLICDECLPKISIGADETVECPQCRRKCPREDLGLIYMTESERWDRLLKVAQAWDRLDRRGAEDTDEEEAEEDFISQGSRATFEYEQTNEVSGGEEDNDPSSPLTPLPLEDSVSFPQSPSYIKRQRLEQLVAARASKRSRQ